LRKTLSCVFVIGIVIALTTAACGEITTPLNPANSRSSNSGEIVPVVATTSPSLEARTPTTLATPTLVPTPTGLPTSTALPTSTVMPDPTDTPAPTFTPLPSPTPSPTPEVAPGLSPFAAGLRPEFYEDIAANKNIPRYYLKINIEPAKRHFQGQERIVYTNRTGRPLQDVALRLYPNFPTNSLGGGNNIHLSVTAASINGVEVSTGLTAQKTAVLLPFASSLQPGETAQLELTFSADISPISDGTYPLPSAYPMLAVREGDNWRLDVTNFVDRVYAESAFYEAEITAPANFGLVTSGQLISKKPGENNSIVYLSRTGPVREFAMSLGDFAVEEAQAGAIVVRVYKARKSNLDAQQVSRVAVGALKVYEKRFGPYPYPVLNFHLQPGTYDGGDEYPGLVMLYSAGQVNPVTRYMVAHETAHQWWYGVVGDDIYRESWLDEAFAQYSGIIYDEDAENQDVAARDWEREVMVRYRQALQDGNLPILRSLADFGNFNVYYRTVYGKGALFLRTLRQEIGDAAFFKALQVYYQRYRYQISTSAAVQKTFEEVSGRSLDSIFRLWLKGT